MQTKPKSNTVTTTTVDATGRVITFTVRGAGPEGKDASFEVDVSTLSEANRNRALLHGITQRISDRAAMARNTTTGKAASPADKFQAMKSLADHYTSGAADWSPARADGATGLDSIMLAAVVEATGKTHEEIRVMIQTQSTAKGVTPKAFLAALAGSKLVAPIVARIRGEQAGVDGDELLADMMGGE